MFEKSALEIEEMTMVLSRLNKVRRDEKGIFENTFGQIPYQKSREELEFIKF